MLENEDFLNEIKDLEKQNIIIIIDKSEIENGTIVLKNISGYEKHYLKIGISDKNRLFVLESSLPVDDRKFFDNINFTSNTLTSFVSIFTTTLKELDDFYANMNTIDTLCYVVEPEHPTTKSNIRIIKYSKL